MRKFTILLAMVAFATFAFGQKGFVPHAASLSKAENVKKEKQQMKNDLQNSRSLLWYEDFNGTKWAATSDDGIAVPANAPAGWELFDFTGSGYFFRWDTVGPRGNFTSPGDGDLYCQNPEDPMLSSTGENGYLMLEADYYNTLPDCSDYTDNAMNAAVVYNVPIDFSNEESVHLIFEQWARFCCAYSASADSWFEVSTDGGETWEAKSVHEEAINDGTANAHTSDFDISPMVAGESSVIFRFRLQGLSHYHWEIDDVRFVVPAANDIVLLDYWNQYLTAYQLGDPDLPLNDEQDFIEGFYHYPWFMAQEFVGFNAAILNFGINDLTNVTHNVLINKNGQELTTYSADPFASFTVGQQDTTEFAQTWTPEGKGNYEFVHYLTTAEGDDNPSNDTLKRAFAIGDSTICPIDTTAINRRMSPDNWTNHVDGRGLGFYTTLPDPSLHGDGTGTDRYIVSGVRIYLSTQEADAEALIESGDANFVAELYKYDPDADALELVIQSGTRVLTLDDTASWVYIPFLLNEQDEILQEGGDYVVNVAFWGTWTDPYGRTASYDIGESSKYKFSFESCMLTDPLGADFGGVQGGAGPAIALGIYFGDDYTTTEYDVTFTVDDGSKAPVEGATVFVGGKQGTTDSNGEAVVALEDGTYDYTIEREGYGDVTGSVTVSGAATSVSETIATSYKVVFEVMNSFGTEIESAKIEINDEELISDVNGMDSTYLVTGTYSYTITKFGYTDYTGSVEVAGADMTETISDFNKTAYPVDFTILDEQGSPIDGAEITVAGESAITNASGEVNLSAFFGTNEFTVTKDGYEDYTGTVTVPAQLQVEATLLANYPISVTVEDNNGATIEGANVQIGDYSGVTGTDGTVDILVVNGTYEVIASKETYISDTADLVVDGAAESVSLTIIPTFKITFNVVDENEDPLEGATIDINGTTLESNADGEASISGLVAGDYPYLAVGNIYQQVEDIVTIEDADVTELVTLPVGISNVNAVDFSIYPNPTNGQFNIDVQGKAQVTILNTVGKVVESMTISGSQQINLDLASGVYFVRVKEGAKVGTKQLIIE